MYSHFETVRLPRPKPTVPLEVRGWVGEDISGDREIDRLITKNERDKKIIELYKAQLLLPLNQRSAKLMARFGIDVSKNGLVDAYPPKDTGVKFHVNMYLPVDKTIPEQARLAGARATPLGLFVEASTGNTVFVHFPLSMHGVQSDDMVKLDNFGTLIYKNNGEPVPGQSDSHNLYTALWDYLHDRDTEKAKAYLATLGMYSPSEGVTFELRGRGITVISEVRNAGNEFVNLVEGAVVEGPASEVSDEELNHIIQPWDEDMPISREEWMGWFDNLVDEYGKPPQQEESAEVPTEPLVEPLVEPSVEQPVEDDDVDQFIDVEETPVMTDEQLAAFKKKYRGELYQLSDVLKKPGYIKQSPFDEVSMLPKYSGYRVVFFMTKSAPAYKVLRKPIFIIKDIDTANKVISVVHHNRAYRDHVTSDGGLDIANAFEKYNKAFLETGDSEKALTQADLQKIRDHITKRMNVWSPYQYSDFPFV